MKQMTKTTGNTEWFTPARYIEAARDVLGGIDLDPASCEQAQETVQAATWYSQEQDGLIQDWRGRVFCNPPYARGVIDNFVRKLAYHVEREDVHAYCILVNSACDTEWFHRLLDLSDMVCFTRGRIAFISPTDKTGKKKPPLGQAFFYGGNAHDDFERAFTQFGTIVNL